MGVLQVTGILDHEVSGAIRQRLPALRWRDGKATAGAAARAVKDNQQADLSSGEGLILRQSLRDAVAAHPVIRAAARPRRFSPILVSKTENGGHYGRHVDNALMRDGTGWLRSDLSFTLFLSDPEDYDRGALVLHSAAGSHEIKLPFGDLVLYPSSDIHEVQPVTRGTRLVAVGWIESLIPDARHRSLLFDLENLRAALRQRHPSDAEELLVLDKTISDLLRMWAQP